MGTFTRPILCNTSCGCQAESEACPLRFTVKLTNLLWHVEPYTGNPHACLFSLGAQERLLITMNLFLCRQNEAWQRRKKRKSKTGLYLWAKLGGREPNEVRSVRHEGSRGQLLPAQVMWCVIARMWHRQGYYKGFLFSLSPNNLIYVSRKTSMTPSHGHPVMYSINPWHNHICAVTVQSWVTDLV